MAIVDFKAWNFDLQAPVTVDKQIRQAIEVCWMMLPEDRRTVEVLKTEIRRILERALANFEEDALAFGVRMK